MPSHSMPARMKIEVCQDLPALKAGALTELGVGVGTNHGWRNFHGGMSETLPLRQVTRSEERRVGKECPV